MMMAADERREGKRTTRTRRPRRRQAEGAAQHDLIGGVMEQQRRDYIMMDYGAVGGRLLIKLV